MSDTEIQNDQPENAPETVTYPQAPPIESRFLFVDAAYSFVRSRSVNLGAAEKEFRETDLHIHFPAGSVPKDGPSAGVAVTLAIASVLSRRKVLEIGGVKEKTLAAYRAGLREVILPKGNLKDLRDIPAEVKQHMVFTFVGTMDEVLQHTLLPKVPVADRIKESAVEPAAAAVAAAPSPAPARPSPA